MINTDNHTISVTSYYNIDYHVDYNDNHSYRNCLRRVFNMNVDRNDAKWTEMDEESTDELLYDDKVVSTNMDFLYSKTQSILEFQTLYDMAAAKMISTDRSIGFAMLFSYNYFFFFHRTLRDFLSNPSVFNSQNGSYRTMIEQLGKK